MMATSANVELTPASVTEAETKLCESVKDESTRISTLLLSPGDKDMSVICDARLAPRIVGTMLLTSPEAPSHFSVSLANDTPEAEGITPLRESTPVPGSWTIMSAPPSAGTG